MSATALEREPMAITVSAVLQKDIERKAVEMAVTFEQAALALLRIGLEEQCRRERELASLIEGYRKSPGDPVLADKSRRGALWFVKIAQWHEFPPAVQKHLIERIEDRSITIPDLLKMQFWIKSDPDVPDDHWCRDFGTFIPAATGQIPRPF